MRVNMLTISCKSERAFTWDKVRRLVREASNELLI